MYLLLLFLYKMIHKKDKLETKIANLQGRMEMRNKDSMGMTLF